MIQNLLNDFLAYLCKIDINFQMFSNNYSINSNISIKTSRSFILHNCVIYFAYTVGKQCTISEYYFFIISICLAAAVAPTPTTVTTPLKVYIHHCNHINLTLPSIFLLLFMLNLPREQSFISNCPLF